MENTQQNIKNKQIILVLLVVGVVLFLDQWLKFHIKTSFTLGQSVPVLGNWFELHFTENPGMAFGLTLGGKWGKIVLTAFRIIASVIIFFYIRNMIKENTNTAMVLLVSLIFAGAVGNIIDSVIYGKIFSASTYHSIATYLPDDGGYAPLFMGKVVDMLYFPLIDTSWPEWVPKIGGSRLQFFRPVFNIADAAISIGVFTIILFRRKLFISQ